MKKMYTKLIAITLLLILSASMVVMSTFAWFVLSKNPVATGIQVSIGGGNTVMVAPDLTQVVDGEVCHYPGSFSDRMHFGQYESYDYLQELGGLTPVSTADGIHWFLPAYYDENDRQGTQAVSGQIKDVQDFIADSELSHANLNAYRKTELQKGSYIYLDFWVVSNGGDYTLRVSAGEDGSGSFLVDLPRPVSSDSVTGYALEDAPSQAASAVRVGFLANDIGTGDGSMLCYQDSPGFDGRYTSLRGFYQEPGTGSVALSENRFTVYEPNCDSHPADAALEGSYIKTQPLGLVDGQITPVSIPVSAQLSSRWIGAEHGEGTAIAQRFQAAVLGMDTKGMSLSQIGDTFYGSYLQGQLSTYVQKGRFIANAGELEQFGEQITAQELGGLQTAGATEDAAIIRLEQHVPQRIRMFIWLEGQDVDCTNQAAMSGFALELELAGGSE